MWSNCPRSMEFQATLLWWHHKSKAGPQSQEQPLKPPTRPHWKAWKYPLNGQLGSNHQLHVCNWKFQKRWLEIIGRFWDLSIIWIPFKVRILREGRKIWKNLPRKIWRYWVASNFNWKNFSNFVAFSEYRNLEGHKATEDLTGTT